MKVTLKLSIMYDVHQKLRSVPYIGCRPLSFSRFLVLFTCFIKKILLFLR